MLKSISKSIEIFINLQHSTAQHNAKSDPPYYLYFIVVDRQFRLAALHLVNLSSPGE